MRWRLNGSGVGSSNKNPAKTRFDIHRSVNVGRKSRRTVPAPEKGAAMSIRFLRLMSVSAFCVLAFCWPAVAGADPGGAPVCNSGPPGSVPGVADCPQQPSDPPFITPVPGPLPYCSVPLMLLPDTAALGGKSWQCLADGVNPALDDPVLPYCSTPLQLVPDAASLGGQRWVCPVGSGPIPAPPPPPPPPAIPPLPAGSDVVVPSTMVPAPSG